MSTAADRELLIADNLVQKAHESRSFFSKLFFDKEETLLRATEIYRKIFAEKLLENINDNQTAKKFFDVAEELVLITNNFNSIRLNAELMLFSSNLLLYKYRISKVMIIPQSDESINDGYFLLCNLLCNRLTNN